MKDLAKMLTAHRLLILNYFRAKKQFNSGIVEGLTNLANSQNRSSPTNSGEEANFIYDFFLSEAYKMIEHPHTLPCYRYRLAYLHHA